MLIYIGAQSKIKLLELLGRVYDEVFKTVVKLGKNDIFFHQANQQIIDIFQKCSQNIEACEQMDFLQLLTIMLSIGKAQIQGDGLSQFLDMKNEEGCSMLHFIVALSNSQISIINPNFTIDYGKIIPLLHEYKANLNIKTIQGITPIQIALNKNFEVIHKNSFGI